MRSGSEVIFSLETQSLPAGFCQKYFLRIAVEFQALYVRLKTAAYFDATVESLFSHKIGQHSQHHSPLWSKHKSQVNINRTQV